MGTTAQKLQAIRDSKAAIKAAIEKKGVANVGDVLSEYPAKIASIPSGTSGWTGHADAEGLRKIGWTDEDIDYFQRYGVSWNEEEDDLFKVPQDNIDLYTSGKLTPENVGNYKTVLYYLPKLDFRDKYLNGKFMQFIILKATPILDLGTTQGLGRMFYGCSSLRVNPLIHVDVINETNNLFDGCGALTEVHLKEGVTKTARSMSRMFALCDSLLTVKGVDTSSAISVGEMFTNCKSLTSILSPLDFSSAASNNHMGGIFTGCQSLRDVTFVPGSIKYNIGLPNSHNLTRESLLSLLEGLAPVIEERICTIDANNLAKLSDEEKAIATDKGWTLV